MEYQIFRRHQKFSENPKDFAGFVNRVRNEALQMALDYISETLCTCNQILKDSPMRREKWEVVRTDEKTLITSIGKVMFSKTLYKNKKLEKEDIFWMTYSRLRDKLYELFPFFRDHNNFHKSVDKYLF